MCGCAWVKGILYIKRFGPSKKEYQVYSIYHLPGSGVLRRKGALIAGWLENMLSSALSAWSLTYSLAHICIWAFDLLKDDLGFLQSFVFLEDGS